MSLPEPTHVVTVQNLTTRAVAVFQVFSRAEAEDTLAAYRDHGWDGAIEEKRR